MDSELLLQGFELLLLGMGIVFGFLTLLVFTLRGMSGLADRLAPIAEQAAELPTPSNGSSDHQRIVAVIGAAVACYRNAHRPDRPVR